MCKCVLVLFALFISSFCEDDDKPVPEYRGLLTPECVRKYHALFISRYVPPRTYRYYHEVNSPALYDQEDSAERTVDIGWRIVGGRFARIQEVPFQVLYGKYCGGALIAPEWVITAAHCKSYEKYVYIGSTQRSEAAPFKVCAHFIHPMWNVSRLHSHDFDYQLVLLETAVPVTDYSRPIAIGSIEDVKPGVMVSISGWGHLQYKKSKMQEYLRRAYVPVMADETCRTMPDGNYDKITPRMFCAGYVNGTKDSCQGDSGGPAVVNGRLVGMVSYGVGCGGAQHPGVYSLVPRARDWIRSVTGLPL
ncbi:unnamed protein product [Colias eurytheme]|nr:unnamed protein product [Colias eurytheme]